MDPDTEDTGAAMGEAPPEIDEVRRELAAAHDNWRRTAADLANVQKRLQREIERGQIAERERVLNLWLNTVDDLERALAHAERDGVEPGAEAALVQGIRSITSQAVNTIAGLGYPRIGNVGDVFDPAVHDVVSTVPPTAEVGANVIAAVVKPGYGTTDHLLRPATVVVAKAPD